MQFNLADLFEKVADTIGERECLVFGSRRLSYREVDERSTRLAHHLAAHGIGPGDHVGVWMQNAPEYIETMLASFKLRAVPINVNYRYRADELKYLFADSDTKAIVYDPEFKELLDAILPDLPKVRACIGLGDEYDTALLGQSATRDFGERSPDDLYILYTGGTTGMPKGVMWRAEDIFFGALGGGNPGGGNISAPEQIASSALAGKTRTLPACPFMHGTAHWTAFSTMFTGGTVVISPDRSFDPRALWSLVSNEKVSFLVIVGDAFARPLVEALRDPDETWDLTPLTLLLSGGAILSPSVKDELVSRLPTTAIVDGFGASETGGQGSMVSTKGAHKSVPRFMMDANTSVLDENFQPIPPGSNRSGLLARKGHIPLGYYKDPDKSALTFPVIDGVRWSIPGDMATPEADGTIALLGRGSVSINTGGEKVFPEEVEGALKSHPEIFDAVVVGLPDDRWGERVTAVVQLRSATSELSLADLTAHCSSLLAGYKSPRQLVLADRIQRSPSGKPDYRWAKAFAAQARQVE